ncbi:helix-turn-helix domain-containing protein [Burkholderia cepacia]|uniref:helix-turn-helix domain-containing protein n=1 Tax=Burkholderia cepacia TaxID=292 RepID=UPI00398E9D94
MARPSEYNPDFAPLARAYALRGATREEIAKALGVTRRTLQTWCKQYPRMKEAIEDGAFHADARIVGKAYDQAMGGDATLLIFWLKNRLGWRDRIDTVARVGISPIDELLSELDGTTFKPPQTPVVKDGD